jgi:outer membrane receptor for ferrienterochelin and colicins
MLDKLIFLTKLSFLALFLLTHSLFAQEGTLHGTVKVDGEPTEFATIHLKNTEIGATSEADGHFHIANIPAGTYEVIASYVGFEQVSQTITIDSQNKAGKLNFDLIKGSFTFNDIVVTGTKTFKRKTDSPVIVNVVSSKTLNDVQACNLSEGLKFQPGLRVETDCQTCNYTQLRMNGLAGGYSQILINGRPVFSPLTGLYGLEQIPVNMIERIEVVRGGGSSLYGSSAVGGTVNVITKVPTKDTYELNYTYQNINGQTHDNVLSGNATLVSEAENSGISFFLNNRERGLYDHNDDNFSELPLLENTSIGTSAFFLPNENQKIEFSLSKLYEFRYGGEMVDKPAYLTQQSEERTHNVWMGNLDYQINFNQENSSLITYAAWQNTKRKHYTGIFPDEPEDIQNHLENAPYGTSNTTTLQAGLQLNHRLNNFLGGQNVVTLGSEYVMDDVYDDIPAYRYLIDQKTTDFGTFLQSDWEIVRNLSLLSGVRMDVHNLIDKPMFSPRASLLYKYKNSTQFRLNYGTGFRAPQAFDTDLHIAFAGGGISRVQLSPDLAPETSQSLSASVNYDKVTEHYVTGFTIEGFRTRLNQAFYLQPIGEDEFGEVFEKQNGQGATVQGVTLELRANFDRKVQIETGFTLQSNEFDTAVEYIDGVEGITEFIRTPRDYGFATLSFMPNKRFNANINYVYTGSMKVPHFAGAPNQEVDEIITSDPFSELSLKAAYNFPVEKIQTNIELYGGVKNIFNSYQEDFDIGKNRDSNFVFGPGLPRTFFVGVKFSGE